MNKYQEALDFLCDHAMEYVEDYDWEENDCGEYYPLDKETLNANKSVLQELIDKATPKKPIEKHYEDPGEKPYIKYCCPNECHIRLYPVTLKKFAHEHQYCPKCGQALDWGEEDEDHD